MLLLKDLKEAFEPVSLQKAIVRKNNYDYPAGLVLFNEQKQYVIRAVPPNYNLISLLDIVKRLKSFHQLTFVNYKKLVQGSDHYLRIKFRDSYDEKNDYYLGCEIRLSYLSRFPTTVAFLYFYEDTIVPYTIWACKDGLIKDGLIKVGLYGASQHLTRLKETKLSDDNLKLLKNTVNSLLPQKLRYLSLDLLRGDNMLSFLVGVGRIAAKWEETNYEAAYTLIHETKLMEKYENK